MPDQGPNAKDHLEKARELVWEAVDKLEEAQRVLFRAGDCYVADVWGDGVRAVIEATEKMADVSGDLTSIHSEIARIARRDRGRDGPAAA